MIGYTIGIGYLQENSTHINIRESLLGNAGVGSCPGISNWCKNDWPTNTLGDKIPGTELELLQFCSFPFGLLVRHLVTQVNNSLLAAQFIVFYLRRSKRRIFIFFLIYVLVYPSIYSILATLDALSPWSDSVCTHTCSPFLRKPLFS